MTLDTTAGARVQCTQDVYKRDTYRYSGGKQRFKLHYRREQCSRKAVKDGLCYQHQPDYWEVVFKRNQERRYAKNRAQIRHEEIIAKSVQEAQ